jgi:hypothetical protein
VAEIWLKISTHVGVSGAAFSEFVARCQLALGYPEPPGSGPDSLDWRQYKKQFDKLHKAIATWITNGPDEQFIPRDFLFSAIGVAPSRSGLIQTFPQPAIPYERNGTAANKVRRVIESATGGYIAIVGPAGVGKSTLVQDLLTSARHPFFIAYYAFLPNTDGNRDRGEALTFFQDAIGRLDGFSRHRHSIGISDVAQGREALRQHMSKASERYAATGQKTILLIDGLDHVSREVGLQSPLLYELPRPDEVPAGFLIILSCQPQALTPGTVVPAVGQAVLAAGRRVEVSGLARSEVHTIVSKLGKATTGADRDKLYEASLGNPLILTYLLTEFQRTPHTTVLEAIKAVGHYTGHLEEYYSDALAVPLQDGATRRLLGLLCRAAPTIPVAWLKEWPESVQIEDIYERVIAPFVRVDDGCLHFIHDSLIGFLKTQTRSKLPEGDQLAEERRFHSILADRCSDRLCSDPLGRAQVFHLLRAGKKDELLNILSSDWLREAVREFLPYELVRPILLSGFEAAWASGAIAHVPRLTLLDYELDQRSSRTEGGRLADTFLELDEPDLAIAQVRAVGRLLVGDAAALAFADNLWRYADDRDRPHLKATAQMLYLQAKPISLIYQSEPIDVLRDEPALQAWASAAPLFESPGSILADVQRLRFADSRTHEDVDSTPIKASLLYRVLVTLLYLGAEIAQCQLLLDAIALLRQPTWAFAAVLRVARANPAHFSLHDLQTAYYEAKPNDDMRLAYASWLFANGHRDEAKDIAGRLAHVRFDATRNVHSLGLSDVSYTVDLRCLQELLGLPEGPVPSVNSEGEEGYGRLEHTARLLGILRATAKSGRPIQDLHATLRSLLLFRNIPLAYAGVDWSGDFILNQSRGEIDSQIMRLATAVGVKGVGALRDVLLDLMHGSAGAQFAGHHRRAWALRLYHEGVLSKAEAVSLGLSSTLETSDSDPTGRQDACFEIAKFLHSLGEQAESRKWRRRAGDVSAGAGSHKDYHMAELAAWLDRSVMTARPEELQLLDHFARAVEVAGGAGSCDAAAQELRLVLRLDPVRAAEFAIELVDRGVLNLSDALEALVIGGAATGASAKLLSAIYCELHALIGPGDTSAAAVATLRRYAIADRAAAALEIMAAARTNSLPSHRAEVGRALRDELLAAGLDEPALTAGLKAGQHDSAMKHSLYRLANGEVETTIQVAARLSDHSSPGDWNPNPTENPEFDWWQAVKKATIQSPAHLDDLLATFRPPHYRAVEELALRSQQLLHIGERVAAQRLARQAIDAARAGSWHRWLDGAQKRIAYGAAKVIDGVESVKEARVQFGNDLAAGELSSSWLLSDIFETFDFLEIGWPADAARDAIADYLRQVLGANQEVSPYASLAGPSRAGSADLALCRFITHLLAFPVVDIGLAARRALARCAAEDGTAVSSLLLGERCWDAVQLEHLLAAVHVGMRNRNAALKTLRACISGFDTCESVAVRAVARRICHGQGWPWKEVRNQPTGPVIVLPKSLARGASDAESGVLVGADVLLAFRLYRAVLAPLEEAGIDREEIEAEFYRAFQRVNEDYRWKQNDRLQRWIRMALARHWLNPRAIVGREAAMRVIGRLALSGRVPEDAESAYDVLLPIYDSAVESLRPRDRPVELRAMDWDVMRGQQNGWLKGENADDWSFYPDSVDGLHIIGERTLFIRPDWEWPREERRRGVMVGSQDSGQTPQILESGRALTYERYLRGDGQEPDQVIVLNSERQLVGPACRWAAFGANFARRLGWEPSRHEPFTWVARSGEAMVKSLCWKDGWTGLEPPRFESLGEGWLVLATEQALHALRDAASKMEVHLWVERHSHGRAPYAGQWHLSKAL